MPVKLLRFLIATGVLSTLALDAASITEASLLIRAGVGTIEVHDRFLRDSLRVEDSFARTVETPPFSGNNNFVGASVIADVQTGGFRGKSNVFAAGQAGVEWGAGLDVLVPVFGPAGTILIPLDMTVRSHFHYDKPAPPGGFASAGFDAFLMTSQGGLNAQRASFGYSYSENTGVSGSIPNWGTTLDGDVLLVENSIPFFEVVLRTVLVYECCASNSRLQIHADVGGTLFGRGGSGGAINAFDSAFLTLTLPPGYTLEPGTPFLSKPFEQPAAIPEPWMTPLVGLIFASLLVIRKRFNIDSKREVTNV